ncbi:MAG: nucleotidyltransferase family protein, partial [Chloroflexi bacterium]|nr:nucleotidyltransferase family protein [Chloroflexota bacterium]
QHGMAPFLYDLVQQGYVSPLPTTVKAQLWAYQRLSAVQNQEMAVEVARLVTGMAAVGVTAVPLKGVALAAAVYGGVNHRQTGDIDLWISPDDLEVCMNQLGEMGYVAKRPFTDAQEHVWRQINYEQTWGHPELKVIVDLHWQLMPPRLAIKFEPMTPLLIQPLADDSISIFAPEDHLLYLCLHGYKHSWYRLSWVVDLACLISTYPNLDWEAVIIQAKK